MIHPIKYFLRSLLNILLCLFLIQCSDTSDRFVSPEPEHIRILEDIPQHISELENVAIFEGDSEPKYSIELTQEQVFGETGEPKLSNIPTSIVDDQNRILILSNDFYAPYPFQSILYAYNTDGSYHTQIGKPGTEPGEYGSVLFVQAKAGKLFLLDFIHERLNVYNSNDYSFEKSTQIEQWSILDHESVQGLGYPDIKTRNDGNHLAFFHDEDNQLIKSLLMDTDGNVLDSAPLTFPTRKTAITAGLNVWPYMGKTVTALSNEDALYSIWTQDFLIKKHDANGVYESAIYYPVKGRLFDPDEFAKTLKFKTRGIMEVFEVNDVEVPETYTIIDDMKIDDENRIWVAHLLERVVRVMNGGFSRKVENYWEN